MEIADTAAAIELPCERPLYRIPIRPRITELELAAGEADVDLTALYDQVVVDPAELIRRIHQDLQMHPQVRLSEVIARHGLRHGLTELVAYLHLASQWPHVAVDDQTRDQVTWQTAEGTLRRAWMPRIIFLREQ
jgi:hypothetical protein